MPGTAGLSVNHPGTALPQGWQWVPLLRLAKQESGHTPSRSHPEYWDGGVPWIGIRDAGAHHGRAISQSIQTVSNAGLANSSARLLPTGTGLPHAHGFGGLCHDPSATNGDKSGLCDLDLHRGAPARVPNVLLDG